MHIECKYLSMLSNIPHIVLSVTSSTKLGIILSKCTKLHNSRCTTGVNKVVLSILMVQDVQICKFGCTNALVSIRGMYKYVKMFTLMSIRGMYKFVQAIFHSDNCCIITRALQSTYPYNKLDNIVTSTRSLVYVGVVDRRAHIMPPQNTEFKLCETLLSARLHAR